MIYKITIALLLLTLNIFVFADPIAPGLTGDDLQNYLIENYKPEDTLGYDNARDVLYGQVDLQLENKLECIYSGFTITLDTTADPSTDAYNKGIDCEHSWPQSMGAENEPQKSDMHHLYPCKSNVNSSRGNYPFSDIPDENTDRWFKGSQTQYSIPDDSLDFYSEKENDGNDCFEVREMRKGDIARSMFYYFCMYEASADTDFWNYQKETLLEWNDFDLPDQAEIDRTWRIADYQYDKPNPFVIDPTLPDRIGGIPLTAPENITISLSGDIVQLTWTPVSGATSYVVESSQNLISWENESEVLVNSWSENFIDSEKFYRVKAKR